MYRVKRAFLAVAAIAAIGVAGAGVLSTAAYAVNPREPGDGPDSAQVDSPCQAGDACESFIEQYINPFIRLLTISVGVLAAISIVVAGIQYASAGSDPGKVQKAKSRIMQTLLGLLAYIFLFSLLNYFVPGGFLR